MKNSMRLSIAAAALLIGVSGVAATGMSKHQTTGSAPAPQASAKDQLSLSSANQKTAWQDISKMAIKVKVPAGFSAEVGATVPSEISAQPVPVSTANKVPALKSYDYALLDNNKLLIINPNDKKVAEIISH